MEPERGSNLPAVSEARVLPDGFVCIPIEGTEF